MRARYGQQRRGERVEGVSGGSGQLDAGLGVGSARTVGAMLCVEDMGARDRMQCCGGDRGGAETGQVDREKRYQLFCGTKWVFY